MRSSIARSSEIALAVRCGSVSFAAPSFALAVACRAFEGSGLRVARRRSAARRRLESTRRVARHRLHPKMQSGPLSFRHSLVAGSIAGLPSREASAVGWRVPVARVLASEPPLLLGIRWMARMPGGVSLHPAHRSLPGRSAVVPRCIAASRPILRASRATPRPSIDILSGVHSPGNIAASGSVHGVSRRESRSVLVVSHHLDGFRRPVDSTARFRGWPFRSTRVAGLLHPAADPGVRCVSGRGSGGDCSPSTSRLPAARFTPLEEVPSPAAVAHPCAPLPPRRFHDLEALLRG